MAAQTFAQIMVTLTAIAFGFSLFLNFLLLLMEELKKYSIIDRKRQDGDRVWNYGKAEGQKQRVGSFW